MKTIHQVIIIGAGASGLGASHTLSKLKIPHIILQSRNRIGGRVNTIQLDGSIIHQGACYIHSPSPTHSILNIMKELNIKPLPNNYNNETYLEQGIGEMNPEQLKKGKQLHKKLTQRIAALSQSLNNDTNIQTVIDQFFKENKHQSQRTIQIANFLAKFQAFFEGSDLKHLSVKNFVHERTSEDFIPPGGFFNILQKVYNVYKPTVLFNHKVTSIDYSESIVHIKTSNNQVFKTKKLISSLPLGVLQKQIVKFNPPLPRTHLHAIKELTPGIMNKIYLKFQEDFWTKKGDWIFLFSKQMLKYNVLVNEAQTSKNVLCVKIGGFQNLSVFDKSDEQIVKQILTFLKKYFNSDKMKLKAYHVTRWHQDQNSYGSYTTLNQGQNRQSLIQLSKPIQNKIWFVGQHCYPIMAFLHSAYQSGKVAASQVANQLKSQERKAKL